MWNQRSRWIIVGRGCSNNGSAVFHPVIVIDFPKFDPISIGWIPYVHTFVLKNRELCDFDCSPSRYLFIQTLVVSQIRGSFLAQSSSKTMNFYGEKSLKSSYRMRFADFPGESRDLNLRRWRVLEFGRGGAMEFGQQVPWISQGKLRVF